LLWLLWLARQTGFQSTAVQAIGVNIATVVKTSEIDCVGFRNSQFLIPTFCLTLPISVRVEKFGIRFVCCRSVSIPTQIMVRAYYKVQTHFIGTALHYADCACQCAPVWPAPDRGGPRVVCVVFEESWSRLKCLRWV
jgi:hypothetical protein